MALKGDGCPDEDDVSINDWSENEQIANKQEREELEIKKDQELNE